MPNPQDFPSRGKITAIKDGLVVFVPSNTSYELHLRVPSGFSGPLNMPVEALIRVQARKVWTVPSGGNFVQPIFGTPRIVQGRVRQATDNQLIIQAGANFVVDISASDVELPDGPICVNHMVNATILPGAAFELLTPSAVG